MKRLTYCIVSLFLAFAVRASESRAADNGCAEELKKLCISPDVMEDATVRKYVECLEKSIDRVSPACRTAVKLMHVQAKGAAESLASGKNPLELSAGDQEKIRAQTQKVLEADPILHAKRLQIEAKLGLHSVFQAMHTQRAKLGEYRDELEKTKAPTQSKLYYFGFESNLAGKSIRTKSGTVHSLLEVLKKHCPDCGVSKDKFKAIAIGNIDDDDTLDIWTIDHLNNTVSVVDDSRN